MRTISIQIVSALAGALVALVVLVGVHSLDAQAAPLAAPSSTEAGQPLPSDALEQEPLPEAAEPITAEQPATATPASVTETVRTNLDPDPPVLHAPPDGAHHVRLAPVLDLSVWDADGDSLTVTIYGRRVLASAAPTFTVVALPDTQYYSCGSLCLSDPALFAAQTEWVVGAWLTRNVAFVTHLGDMVEFGDLLSSHWQNADAAITLLEAPERPGFPNGIPYGLGVGNHDQYLGTSLYNQHFGADRFLGRAYYGGHFGTANNNHYELFDAGLLEFIAVHLEYDSTPDPAVLDWAESVLRAYPERRAIVTSHYLIETGNPGGFGTQGQAIYDELRDNPNLFLMLCGHVSGEGRRSDTYHGQAVHTLLADYQDRPHGGDGWLRILEFSPAEGQIQVRTYSPTLDQWETDADSEFILPYEMQRSVFQVIGVYTDVVPGSHVMANWDALFAGTEYEWYAAVSDGMSTTVGPQWSFTTMDLITKTASDLAGPPLVVGDLIRYAITVTNDLTMTLTSVFVTDTLPAGVAFVSAEPPEVAGSDPPVWDVGALLPGEIWTAAIIARVDGTANPIGGNVAQVGSDQRGFQATQPVFPPGGGGVIAGHRVYLPLALGDN